MCCRRTRTLKGRDLSPGVRRVVKTQEGRTENLQVPHPKGQSRESETGRRADENKEGKGCTKRSPPKLATRSPSHVGPRGCGEVPPLLSGRRKCWESRKDSLWGQVGENVDPAECHQHVKMFKACLPLIANSPMVSLEVCAQVCKGVS